VNAPRREAGRAPWRLIVAALCGSLVVLAEPSAAQQPFAFSGFVQWISGATMQVMGDNGYSIRVDLQTVDQSSYNTLRGGDRVRVFGYVSPDRSRVIAQRIDRSDAPNVYDPYSPYPQAP
jgi:hypothetical protein